MSAVLSLRVNDNIYNQLDSLSKKSGIDKTKFLKQALLEYMEDREDYFLAVEALEDLKAGRDKTVTWNEVKKELDL